MSPKTSGRIVGAMLLLAFVLYGGGSLLALSVTGEPAVLADVIGSETRLRLGVLLMLLNSVVVVTIGVAAYPVLRRHHPLAGWVYLLTRGLEATLLAVSSVLLLSLVPLAHELDETGDPSLAAMARIAQETSAHSYWVAMLGLSLGSLWFCRALLHGRLVPRPLAAWGVAGYVLLATGSVLELLGHRVGVLLAAPGGLFEAALGVLLLVKGFPELQQIDPSAAQAPAPATIRPSQSPVVAAGSW